MGLGSSNLGAAHGYGRKAWEDSGLRARHRGNMTELGDTHDAYFLRRRPRGARCRATSADADQPPMFRARCRKGDQKGAARGRMSMSSFSRPS